MIISLLGCKVAAQLPNTLPKNKFGLQVIDNQYTYALSVQADSNKKIVDIRQYIQPLKVTFYYATKQNFTQQKLYKKPILLARLATVKCLQKAVDTLKKQGLGLIFFDAYRPYSVTIKMWEIVPDDRYAANPAFGSGHNRGVAVDVALYNLQTGGLLDMPTAFDDFTEKAHHNYMQLNANQIKNRNILKAAMEHAGFNALSTEWWHYSLPNAKDNFEILDIPFAAWKKWLK